MSAASLRDGVTSVSGNMEDAEKNFSYISTLSYDKVADYFIVYSTEGTADEIAVISGGELTHQGKAQEILPELMRGAGVAACCRQKEAFAQ